MANPTPEEILNELEVYSREPFLEVLADILACRPTVRAVKKFANKYPDRWAQAVAIMSRLGGYSEKIEIEKTLVLKVKEYSDMELDAELEQLRQEIKRIEKQGSKGRLIEGTVVPQPLERLNKKDKD